MKHAAVALDYEQRIASLEADNRAMQAAILDLLDLTRELRTGLDAMHTPSLRLLKEEARLAAMRRYGQGHRGRKACQVDENSAKIERQGGALASPTLPNRDAVERGQANGC